MEVNGTFLVISLTIFRLPSNSQCLKQRIILFSDTNMPRFSSRFISSFVLFGFPPLSVTVVREIRLRVAYKFVSAERYLVMVVAISSTSHSRLCPALQRVFRD